MNSYILLIAIIILLCLFMNKISNRVGVPMLLAFIVLGMLFGTDGILKIDFENYAIAEQICSISLIFIMFYGGFGTNWQEAKPAAVKAGLLSTIGVCLTALLTGIFCHYILHFAFWESLLIGAVISSTDAASVFSILRSKRLNLKNNTASMLEVESGSNDPCSYMLTVIILSVMSGNFSGGQLVLLILSQMVFGVCIGVAAALISSWVLTHVRFSTDGFDTIFVFGMALIAYAVASELGGNGYLSTYIAGIVLGNRPLPKKKSLVHFFDGITGLMQMLIFFLLGLLAFPSQLPAIMPYALAIALFLTFIARPISVFAILTPFHCSFRQQLLVSWSGLRGAASIVFAIMATVSPAYMKQDVFHIVIFIVLFSIAVQGSLLSLVAKKLDMIDDESNVLKTFSDYSDEMPVEFVSISVDETHPWANHQVKDIQLIPDLLLVLIFREQESLIPNGDTTVLAGDRIVLSALSPEENLGIGLSEMLVERDSKWAGKSLANIKLGEGKLVIMIRRENQVLIPNGDTVLEKNDKLVVTQL